MTDSEQLEEASTALTQWLSPDHCAHLIAAVITKYIALTPEELQEWQVRPTHLYGPLHPPMLSSQGGC